MFYLKLFHNHGEKIMMVFILFLTLFNSSLFCGEVKNLTIPSGEIVNEELYWRSYNDYVDQQKKLIETRSEILIRKENLKALKLKELSFIKLGHSGASSKLELNNSVLKRKKEQVEIKILRHTLKEAEAKFEILKSRIKSSLDSGFKGNLKSLVAKNNTIIYNSKCQVRYLKVYLNKTSFKHTRINYKRMLRLYSTSKPSVTY